jgi:glycosyl transferase cpsJ
MSKPKISVIMSEYNTPPDYLRASIESILNQTFKDIEIIIVDDCGRNDLSSIVKEYKDKRIRIIKNDENIGLVKSLNKAIAVSKADILARMDTDDVADENRLEEQYNFMINHEEYSVVGTLANEFSKNNTTGVLGKPGEKTAKSLAYGDSIIHPSVMMRKKDIQSVGGYKNYKRAEDLSLWFELAMKGFSLFVIDRVLLNYRVNEEDYSKRKFKTRRGEIKARLHYYHLTKAPVLAYLVIIKSIVSSILPTRIVAFLRRKIILKPSRENERSDKRPLVSVIIPVYNCEEYIGECIDSVAEQTYDNIEIIVVNDGSKDESENIIKDKKKRYRNILYYKQRNKGVSAARNLGINKAKGKYITFVDGDDLVGKYLVERLVNQIIHTDPECIIVSKPTQKINEFEERVLGHKKPVVKSMSSDQALIKLLYPYGIDNGPCAKLYPTALLKKNLFNIDLSIAEDLELNYRLIKSSKIIKVLNEKLYFYRPNPKSAMNQEFNEKRLSGLTATDIIIKDALSTTDNRKIQKAAAGRHFIEAVLIASDPSVNKSAEGSAIIKRVILKNAGLVMRDFNMFYKYRIVAAIALINYDIAIKLLQSRGR